MIDYISVLIPFFFVFAIVYGALEFSGVFKNKRVNLIIACVMGFFAISNPAITGFITGMLPYAVIFFVVFFFLGFLFSVFRRKGQGKPDYTLLMIIAALCLIFFSGENEILLPAEELIPWIVLGTILLIFLAVYKSQ